MASWPGDRILNPPITLHWAGWTTTTYDLQRAGWMLSADQDYRRDSIRFALLHRGIDCQGMTDAISMGQFHYLRDCSAPALRYQLANRMLIRAEDMGNFSAVDCTPSYINTREQDLGRYDIFQKVQPHVEKQVFLEQASLEEILSMALAKQQPEQERIRQEMLREKNLQRYSQPYAQLRLVA